MCKFPLLNNYQSPESVAEEIIAFVITQFTEKLFLKPLSDIFPANLTASDSVRIMYQ